MADMIFNNIDFTPYFKVEEITRSMMPSREIKSKNMPNFLGERFARVDMGATMIDVKIRVYEKTKVLTRAKIREVAKLLHTSEPQRLILRDDPNLFNIAVLSGDTSLERLMTTEATTLSFYCGDPLAYSLPEKIVPVSSNTTITNNGSFQSVGVFNLTMTSNTSYLRLRKEVTGEQVYIQHPFSIGDTVVINLIDESVRKNGTLIMEDVHLISDFFEIPVGSSVYTLTNGSGNFIFREGWL